MRRYWFMIVGALVVALMPSAALATPPPTPAFGSAPVDPYGASPLYQCDAGRPPPRRRRGLPQHGPRRLPRRHGRATLWAPCNSPNHISTSTHHAGRAWDWFVTAMGNRSEGAERAMADELVAWLLEPVDGVADARARRLGIVEMIWFDQRWSAQTKAWRPYNEQGLSRPGGQQHGMPP